QKFFFLCPAKQKQVKVWGVSALQSPPCVPGKRDSAPLKCASSPACRWHCRRQRVPAPAHGQKL
ncbi:MAG: hypothetical protein MUC60_14340, partial [Oscillatoria sp. Prado101]|nr:hypothetical protein [Oscillatoria sp. Prado101]